MIQPAEHAGLLLRKAAQDEFVLAKLTPDPDSPDEVIGFHAQQAVEKMLKAVLAACGISFRRTHDLVELIDILGDSGLAIPANLEDIRRLTPFAIAFRYDDLPSEPSARLDRTWTLDRVQQARAWAESMIRGDTAAPET